MLETERLQVVEFFRATDAQWKNFEELVRLRRGKIQVLVHPFYWDLRDWTKNEANTTNSKTDYDSYTLTRDRFIRICLGRVPIIILEQDKEYDLLEKRLPVGSSYPVYAIRTRNEDNLPLSINGTEAWLKITEKLRNAGVTHATVGGVAMIIHRFTGVDDLGAPKLKPEFLQVLRQFLGKDKLSAERWIGYTTEGCAGTTARYLALSGIDVALSPISYPHNPRIILGSA